MVRDGDYVQLRDFTKESNQSPGPPYSKGKPTCTAVIEMGNCLED